MNLALLLILCGTYLAGVLFVGGMIDLWDKWRKP